MTAEIAIINRSGIALAADSAVTIGRQRVWKTTNKLFSLAPQNDIAIMVYGNGDFMGLPWDTVIKEFRRSKSNVRFETVDKAADAFFDFLKNEKLGTEEIWNASVYTVFIELAELIAENIEFDGKIDFRKQFLIHAKALQESYNGATLCSPIGKPEFIEKYGEQCVEFFKEILEQNFTKPMRKAVHELCYDVFRKGVASQYFTGVVFAGFGSDEFLPHVRDYMLDGKHRDGLRVWLERSKNLNIEQNQSGVILPFGQADIAYLFMEGIGVGQEQYVEETLRDVLTAKSAELVKNYVKTDEEKLVEQKIQHDDDKKIVQRFMEEFRSYRQARVIQPVMSVVSTLPKEEMAAMAEALVDITGLRRKVDSRIESVSGPIDVAFISKGDGFIWMKRKHYFDLAMNGDFVKRKSREAEGHSNVD